MFKFKTNKNKKIVYQTKTAKIQNLTLYFTSTLILFIMVLLSYLPLTASDSNYYVNSGNMVLIIILILVPIKRLIAPSKMVYGNYYIYFVLVVMFVLYNEYINNASNLSTEITILGMCLSTFATLVTISVNRTLLSGTKKIIYSSTPHRR